MCNDKRDSILVATNTARDVGPQLLAMSIWDMKASGGKYAAVAALTNIPAMFFAIILYEILLTDSARGIVCCARQHADYLPLRL